MPNLPDSTPVRRAYSPLAGFLSYLVPGLGQIYQGRVAKGLLFMICLYGLFFYGMYLGSGKIVASESRQEAEQAGHEALRGRAAGSEKIIYNVYLPDTAKANNPWKPLPPLASNLWSRLQFTGQFWIGVAAWPAIWQYANFDERENHGTLFGTFERAPTEDELNLILKERDKTWDLGWVYTVIAGVLNILVIYDAFAGPAFAEGEPLERSKREAAPA